MGYYFLISRHYFNMTVHEDQTLPLVDDRCTSTMTNTDKMISHAFVNHEMHYPT